MLSHWQSYQLTISHRHLKSVNFCVLTIRIQYLYYEPFNPKPTDYRCPCDILEIRETSKDDIPVHVEHAMLSHKVCVGWTLILKVCHFVWSWRRQDNRSKRNWYVSDMGLDYIQVVFHFRRKVTRKSTYIISDVCFETASCRKVRKHWHNLVYAVE